MGKIAFFKHMIACSQAAKMFTSSLVGELAKTVTEAIKEMESVKADKQNAVQVTIQKTGWKKDDNKDYPQFYDIQVEGVTEKDRADVTISPNSLTTAISCGICPTNETVEGKIRIRASSVPADDIVAEYWITAGKE